MVAALSLVDSRVLVCLYSFSLLIPMHWESVSYSIWHVAFLLVFSFAFQSNYKGRFGRYYIYASMDCADGLLLCGICYSRRCDAFEGERE
jgi:hypothetical protein